MTAVSGLSFHLVDGLVLAVIVLSIIISLVRGLAKELISLLSWVIATWAAFKFYVPLSELMQDWINTPSARHVIAFCVLFVSTLLIGGAFNFLMGHLV